MRIASAVALGAAAVALAGCMVPPAVPIQQPLPPVMTMPAPVAPSALPDAATLAVARGAIVANLQSSLQGVNVQPYADCVMTHATPAELMEIAEATRMGQGNVAGLITPIVRRDTTATCIAGAAQTG